MTFDKFMYKLIALDQERRWCLLRTDISDYTTPESRERDRLRAIELEIEIRKLMLEFVTKGESK